MTTQRCEAPNCHRPALVVLSMMGTDSPDGVTAVCIRDLTIAMVDWVADPEGVKGWCVTLPPPPITG